MRYSSPTTVALQQDLIGHSAASVPENIAHVPWLIASNVFSRVALQIKVYQLFNLITNSQYGQCVSIENWMRQGIQWGFNNRLQRLESRRLHWDVSGRDELEITGEIQY